MVDKERVLNYLVKNDVTAVNDVGRVFAEYYTDKPSMMKLVRANKRLPKEGEEDKPKESLSGALEPEER